MKFFKSLFASASSFTLNSASVQSFTESWPQIKAYYEILLKPSHEAEKGNLESIKSYSGTLLEKADELTVENLPAEYRNPKTIETLISLKNQTKFINELVLQDADEEIKAAVIKLKSIFYNIVELCLSK